VWTTEQTKQENKQTIASASEIARSEREYRQSQMERQYADKAARDDQKRWWKLYEGETAIDGASVGVGEPAENATLYTGPMPPKATKVGYRSDDGERVFKPYRIETQIPCS